MDCVYNKIFLVPSPYFPMPHPSGRQKHANALLEAYILSVIHEVQEGTSMHYTDSEGSWSWVGVLPPVEVVKEVGEVGAFREVRKSGLGIAII